MRHLVLPLAAAITLTAGAASALTQRQEAIFRTECGGDYMRLCGDFKPGTPEIEMCFKRKAKELSPGCSKAIADFQKSGATQ